MAAPKKKTKARTSRAAAPAAVDWAAREAEVADLAELAGVADKVDRPNPPRTQVVRWQELSTPELVALAQAGHMDAFDPLYRRYAANVRRYAAHVCAQRPSLIEDVASEAWLRAIRSIDHFQLRVPAADGGDSFWRWLCSLIRSCRGEALRAQCQQIPGELRGEWSETDWLAVSAQAEDDQCSAKQELLARLHAEIERLSPMCREVVRRRLTGAGPTDIARDVGLSTQQVYGAESRARTELRRRLAGRLDVHGISEAERGRWRELARELPTTCREVALLRLARLNLPQIAEATGMTVKQTCNAWRRAEDRLRQLMDDPGASRQPRRGRMIDWHKERDRLRAATDLLTPRQRQIAELRLDGLTNTEIAERLECSTSAVNCAWYAALNQFTQLGLLGRAA